MIESLNQIVDIQALTTRLVAYVPNLLSALILVLAFWIVHKIAQRMMNAALKKVDIATQASNLLLRAVKYAIVIFACLTIANQLKINVTSLIAGVGVMGLALSFAAQDTVGNVISGIVIIIDGLFREGDWISIGDLHASVTKIRLRTTILTTFDNETVIVPNKQLVQERIVNYTLTPKTRVRVTIGIAYKDDIQKARDIMLDTVKGDSRVLEEPKPVVILTSLGDSSVNLQLRFWTEDPIQKYSLMWDYTEKCKYAFDREGIEIPFPHMQLFLEKTEGLKMLASGNG